MSAQKAYNELGCRCPVCREYKQGTRGNVADSDAAPGPIEQAVLDDCAAAELGSNPRRAQLLATARHLARLLDQGKVSSPAAAAKELNATTEALHRKAEENDAFADHMAEIGRPTLVPAPIRDTA